MNHCKDCKHWLRGTVSHYPADMVDWKDRPHRLAGQTVTNRPYWACHPDDQDIGECLLSHDPKENSRPLMVGTCDAERIYGELVTDAEFGCILFAAMDHDWDHYLHDIYDRKGGWITRERPNGNG